jgi:DNA mismatch endonuclease, patch repair protein
MKRAGSRKMWREPPRRPYMPRSADKTSVMMSKVKSKGGKAETLLRKALWRLGYRYRLHTKAILGKPDLTLARYRTVVFVDGDFWHGRGIVDNGERAFGLTLRTKRRRWWVNKIKGNVQRDKSVTRTLTQGGWHVIRVWESHVLKDPKGAATEIHEALRAVERPPRPRPRAPPGHRPPRH